MVLNAGCQDRLTVRQLTTQGAKAARSQQYQALQQLTGQLVQQGPSFGCRGHSTPGIQSTIGNRCKEPLS